MSKSKKTTTRERLEPQHASSCDCNPCRCGAEGYSHHPTRGWMYSQLERLGIRARGIDYTDTQLAEMLRDRGYDVSASPRKKCSEETDR